jgi:hypothetical protein
VQAAPGAAAGRVDACVLRARIGRVSVPARTAVVFVLP